MGWGSYAICDEHFTERYPGRQPIRAIGSHEPCHVEGCTKTGDIFVRAYVTRPREEGEVTPRFSSDLHALAMGFMIGEVTRNLVFQAELEVDETGAYTSSFVLTFQVVDTWVRMRLSTEMIDDDRERPDA